MNRLLKAIVLELKKLGKTAYRNLNWLLDIGFIILIVVIFKSNEWNNHMMYLIISLFISTSIIKTAFLRLTAKIPMLKENLTIKKSNGDIIVKEGQFNKLIIYCNMIEEYIDKNGLRDLDSHN